MKKLLAIVLAAMVCCFTFTFVACGSEEHTHSYGAWSITKQANCTQTGERTKSCSCGDVKTETIPAMGHNYVGGVCTDCGATK